MTSDRLRARLCFEAPWITALLVLIGVALTSSAALILAFAAVWTAFLPTLFLTALGVRDWRPMAAGGAIVLGLSLLLPAWAIWLVFLCASVMLAAAALVLRINVPHQPMPLTAGDRYAVNNIDFTVPDLVFEGRFHLVKDSIREELIELARVGQQLLEAHGIAFTLAYGSLLGAVRHGGPIPWDDDVDFEIRGAWSITAMTANFEELRRAAATRGYELVPHGDYWKLSRPNLSRFPCLDLYRGPIEPEDGGRTQNVMFAGLLLPAPEHPEEQLRQRYGPDCLVRAINDLPFWDSGFLPAILARLVGYGGLSFAERAYNILFSVKAK